MNPHKYISWYSGIRQHLKSEVIDYTDFSIWCDEGSISQDKVNN